MTQFSNVFSSFLVNNQILFFDGHNSHFDDRAPRQMNCRNIQPFILKAGNSINNQPNDNGPNSKLNYLYNMVKSVWMLKYGTTKFFTLSHEIRLCGIMICLKGVSWQHHQEHIFEKKATPPSALPV